MKEEDILLSIALDRHEMLNVMYQVAMFLMTCESQVKHGYRNKTEFKSQPHHLLCYLSQFLFVK